MMKMAPPSKLIALLATAISLLVLGHPAWPQTGTGPGWDEDGGHSGDYRGVARLQWAGPGSPGTFEQYQARRGDAPFASAHLFTTGPIEAAGRSEKALVLVHTGLYGSIQATLDRYADDLADEGYTVEVHQASGGNHESLKSFILGHATDLVGCVLVGDQAAAWFEHDHWGYEEFPCDLYLMDLDGDWLDNDQDGRYDLHQAGSGDEGPEIFIGRIDASMMSGNEAAMTNDYLDKNHVYRTGGFSPPGHALTYTEDDWAMFWDIRTDIQSAYPSFDDVPAPATNKSDYVGNRVPDPAYEFIQLACHSWSQGHAFTRGGNAYWSEIQAAPPQAVFYNLFCCSSLRFSTSDFIGGAYIYDTGSPSLAVIGSTKTGSMLEFWAFYQPFGNLHTFGESFRRWFNKIAPFSAEEIAWHYGMTVAGDPFLHIEPPGGICNTVSYCTAKVSSLGHTPAIGSLGTPSVQAGDFEVSLIGGIPGKKAVDFWGDAPNALPFYGGTLCVLPPVQRGEIRVVDEFYFASWAVDVTPEMAGTTRFYQAWFRDSGDPHGVGLTGGLKVDFCQQ